MAASSELLGGLMANVDGLFLFTPSNPRYEQFAETDVPTAVIAPENTVEAETFVELPLQFQNARDRIRFGVEGTMEQSIVEAGDTIACNVGTFGGDPDSLVHVRVEENMRSGIYDLFANLRMDPDAIRGVFEVAIELGKKGQKGEPVDALFIIGDASKVMNRSRPLSYNPFEKFHVYTGDPIVDVVLKEFSRLDGALIISNSEEIVSAYRYPGPSAEGVDILEGLDTCHIAGDATTRDANATAIIPSESDGLVWTSKGGKMVLEIDPEVY